MALTASEREAAARAADVWPVGCGSDWQVKVKGKVRFRWPAMAVAVVRGSKDEDVSCDKDGEASISRAVLDAYEDVVESLEIGSLTYNRLLDTNPREVARRLKEGA